MIVVCVCVVEWLCMGACGGGDGRKRMFSRGTDF